MKRQELTADSVRRIYREPGWLELIKSERNGAMSDLEMAGDDAGRLAAQARLKAINALAKRVDKLVASENG